MSSILIVIAVIVFLVIILTLIMGNEMRIERCIIIHKPVNQVYDYLKFTRNQDNFSTWNRTDPEMERGYEGVDGQVGFIYKWDSKNKNVGAGEQETVKIEEGESIEYQLRFSRPMKNVAYSKFIFNSEDPDSTTVFWQFYGPTKFPMTLLKPIFQKMLGKDLDNGLIRLKEILEN